MTFLREDNTKANCAIESDLFPMTGRKHVWRWISLDSNKRVCATCGREDTYSPPRKRKKPEMEDVTGCK